VTSKAVSENPLGLGLVVVGAAALAIAAFLPLVQPVEAFPMVEDNTLIQHGGWVFLACALGIVGTGYRASQGKQSQRWLLIVICAFAAWLVFQNANDKGLRTLYPVGPDGTPDTSQPGVVAGLGIAMYVAGAGVAAAFMGALTFFSETRRKSARVAPTGERKDGVHQRVDQPRPEGKRQGFWGKISAHLDEALIQLTTGTHHLNGDPKTPDPNAQPNDQAIEDWQPERAALEAEAEAAEAEAQAAEARARLIRLRLETQGNAKPAPGPQNSEPPQG
jgi:hypothetical protein